MDFRVTYKTMDSAIKAQQMFQLRQKKFICILDGKCKEARQTEKKLAKMAVKDFEIYTTLPNINFHNIPFKESLKVIKNIIKYRIYNAFCKKTPEEKQLYEQRKKYYKSLTPEQIKSKTLDIKVPNYPI